MRGLMSKMFIEYKFSLSDGQVLNYKIDFERDREARLNPQDYPSWCALNFHQCANCPLDPASHSHCPVAIDAKEILLGFREILSFKETDVWVKTPEREYFKRCDAQTGLRALIGFVMATSACPVLSPALRGMAHFHLPFASIEEIIFRTASSYLLSQYFVAKDGGAPDLALDGLKKRFQEIQTVNYDFLQRIRAASEADSNLDVLSTLFSISSLISLSLEGQLEHLRPLFGNRASSSF
jgi:hypothetical protein